MNSSTSADCISIDVPGRGSIRITHLLLDYNGTLARDGVLLPEVAERVRQLSKRIEVTVLTADTQGTAKKTLAPFPVHLEIISTGEDKRKALRAIRENSASASTGIAAIGNGANDLSMLRDSDLGIAVLGPEGLSCELLHGAAILTSSIQDALDLLLQPKRIIGTLRP